MTTTSGAKSQSSTTGQSVGTSLGETQPTTIVDTNSNTATTPGASNSSGQIIGTPKDIFVIKNNRCKFSISLI